MTVLGAVATVAVLLATLVAPSGPALPGAPGRERSVLAFLPDHVRAGRWEVDRANDHRFPDAPGHQGVFWRTGGGDVHTRLTGYDAALARRHAEPVVARVRADAAGSRDEGPPEGVPRDPAAMLPLLGEVTYGRDAPQYSFEEWVFAKRLRADVLLPTATAACRGALAAHETAARRAVARLTPQFTGSGGTQTWRIETAGLLAATRGSRETAERACLERPEAAQPLMDRFVEVVRSASSVSVRLAGEGGQVRESVTFHVVPGPVGAPPLASRPVSGWDPVTSFLVAVSGCRGLPYEYSNFAAGDSFTAPDSKSYAGPTAFSERWACAADVPPDMVSR